MSINKNKQVQTPRFIVQKGVWVIDLHFPDGNIETLTGMPNYHDANANYEALQRFITSISQTAVKSLER